MNTKKYAKSSLMLKKDTSDFLVFKKIKEIHEIFKKKITTLGPLIMKWVNNLCNANWLNLKPLKSQFIKTTLLTT